MTGFIWRMVAGLVGCVIGLFVLFWALELIALDAFRASATGTESHPGVGVYLLLFGGLVLVNLSTFYALTRWSRYLHDHPNTKQLAVLLQVSVLAVAGGALVFGIAVHSDWVRAQEVVPAVPSLGFIAYEVLFATIAISALVLLAVRWSPGFRRRPIED